MAKSGDGGIYTTRTEPPFADATFAYAENVRTRGGEFSAMQRISPNQPLKRIVPAEFQTALSRRSDLTIEMRTKRPSGIMMAMPAIMILIVSGFENSCWLVIETDKVFLLPKLF